MPTLRRTYYTAVALVALLFASLWFGREITFWLYGFDWSLIDSASAESFRAYRETAAARSALLWTVGIMDMGLLALSVAMIVRWRRGMREIHPGVAAAVLLLTLLGALVFIKVQLSPPPVMLGLAGR